MNSPPANNIRSERVSSSITILGSTGSIGKSTLEVIALHPCYQVFALTANNNVAEMLQQCLRFQPRFAVMVDADAANQLEQVLMGQGSTTRVLAGEEGLLAVATHSAVDTVMAAIVGAAGLPPTLAAVEASKKVLLANKEALIMAGELFMTALAASDAILLPIDSEHNAVFQCLPPESRLAGSDIRRQGVRKIVLTASGGPFRDVALETLQNVTPAQACRHPNWSMGKKISVDSATMMNKGLEVIEACFLFGTIPRQIEVLIHPQSIVHSMVEYLDGSVIAQLGSPDMRIPISYSLAWPERMNSGASFLDLTSQPDLQFFTPDLIRFPCLRLGIEAAEQGGTAPTILNAANEIAVDSFLSGRIGFMDIPVIIARVQAQITCRKADTIAIIRQADEHARAIARELTART
ncbi:MAG: 1-deoxy-D-xylulose-5-phosphate reductoisomerase [Gammaproteobacteria bacterium]|nr:1-deoxy-D-xylulose-5-phosphate reductoisomerase [Gammaproteobacteria bacterium]MDP2140955.1 1-deoxy-D-xylulose-5-phosphate reductoisomerase [Gammaproteobacteria bacterium]MDP2349301.1 1-deoxy-D-xylulose-5-phosphate reductoisomerase [Gammaproteobacteria bacterium]